MKNTRVELFPGSTNGRLIIEAHRVKLEIQYFTYLNKHLGKHGKL